jgi:NAD(P)-dependent dehydrogenase (short-subunit alcohol dehydrogenase family)
MAVPPQEGGTKCRRATRDETDGAHSILVNNAGVSPGKPQWMESFEDFWRTIEINFKSVSLCHEMARISRVITSPPCRENESDTLLFPRVTQTMVTSWYMLPKFRERKSGVIINIASRAATVDFPFAVGYNSSKAAVARATSTLQEEVELDGLGDGIQLYALHPGGVPTAMAKSAYSVISPPPCAEKKDF